MNIGRADVDEFVLRLDAAITKVSQSAQVSGGVHTAF
jgi:hypothetical protein